MSKKVSHFFIGTPPKKGGYPPFDMGPARPPLQKSLLDKELGESDIMYIVFDPNIGGH